MGLKRTERDVTRFQLLAHFMMGEHTRRCQTAFRQAKGSLATTDEIAVTTMREENLDMGDRALRQGAGHVDAVRMLKTGAVIKQDWGCKCAVGDAINRSSA